MNKTYEKPKMKFVSLRNRERVAATCWGDHGLKKYYDFPYSEDENVFDGYVQFGVASGNCGLDNLDVDYYEGGKLVQENLSPDDIRYQWLKEALLATSNANEANNFDAAQGDFPDDPGGMS